MHQLFNVPPDNMPTRSSARGGESTRSVIVGLVVACLLIAGIIVALVATGLLKHQSLTALQGNSPLTASIGEPLTINNVTVTLTSAASLTANQSGSQGQVIQGVTFSLHFQNQTNSDQHLSLAQWQFLDGADNTCPIVAKSGDLTVSLAPNATLDRQYTASMSSGAYGPYTLLTDVTNPNGGTLGWSFSG